MKSYQFPKDFLWGTATSAYQIEGNNKKSDWWAWEHRNKNKGKWPLEPSLLACDSYRRFEEDFDLAVELNNNAIRIGLEWARLEPEPGKFDQKELAHYKKVLQAAKDRGLKTFVTLHHFTNPVWIADMGGWVNPKVTNHFAKYTKKCAEEFRDMIDFYITVNEPQVYSLLAFLLARWVPQSHNPFKVLLVQKNMRRAHQKAYLAIKEVANYPVGLVKNIAWYEPSSSSKNPLDKVASGILRFLNNDFFLKPIKDELDFLGLNYYFSNKLKNLRIQNPNDKISDLGWWLETKGIKKVLLDLKRYQIPIYITENGLADAQDKYRTWYLRGILKSCAQARDKGVDLKGYFHWSLIDNYEWAEGYRPRFGLVEIDRENNLQRKPRPSFYEYAKICKSGTISR